MHTRNRRTVVRRSLTTLAAVVVLAFAGMTVFSGNNSSTPTPAVTDTYSGTDQDAVLVDPYMLGNISPRIADALRQCPGNEKAWVDNDLGHSLDVAKLTPCLHAVTIADLHGDKLSLAQAKPGYNISVANSSKAPGNDDLNILTLDYDIHGDILFAATARVQGTNGVWTAWQYHPDLFGAFPAHLECQIALFSYDTAHEAASDPTATLPPDFDWPSFMPQMLRR